VIDVRELRKSERRIGASQIFAGGDPSMPGSPPQIVVRPPEMKELEAMARKNSSASVRR
jgi:hypothetical protein